MERARGTREAAVMCRFSRQPQALERLEQEHVFGKEIRRTLSAAQEAAAASEIPCPSMRALERCMLE
jgi:hypothetical protein